MEQLGGCMLARPVGTVTGSQSCPEQPHALVKGSCSFTFTVLQPRDLGRKWELFSSAA